MSMASPKQGQHPGNADSDLGAHLAFSVHSNFVETEQHINKIGDIMTGINIGITDGMVVHEPNSRLKIQSAKIFIIWYDWFNVGKSSAFQSLDSS